MTKTDDASSLVQAILYYYQSGGRLRRPFEVPEDVFIEELEFYQLDESIVREFKQKEGFVVERKEMPTAEWQREIWLLCEEPDSSRCARAFAVVSVSCILVSIVNFCTETIPTFAERSLCINVTVSAGDIGQEAIFKQVRTSASGSGAGTAAAAAAGSCGLEPACGFARTTFSI